MLLLIFKYAVIPIRGIPFLIMDIHLKPLKEVCLIVYDFLCK